MEIALDTTLSGTHLGSCGFKSRRKRSVFVEGDFPNHCPRSGFVSQAGSSLQHHRVIKQTPHTRQKKGL